MHELALAQSIVQLLAEKSTSLHYQRVKQVWLEFGALACIEVSSLQFGLEVATRNTLASEAIFHITILPARGWCLSCSQPFTTEAHTALCPHCHSGQVQIENGTQMRIRELEVE